MAKKASRLTNYALALFIILALNFLLPRLMPGDPLQTIYGEEALVAMTPELEAEIVRRFSLNLSGQEQFLAYLEALFRADLGYSYYYTEPVADVILGFLPWTLLLAGLTLLISSSLGLVLGIESGYRRGGGLDRALLSGLMFLSGFPDFFVGILLLLLFGVFLGLVPLAGAVTPYSDLEGLALALDVLHHLALPLAALVLVQLAPSYLLTRNTMVTTMGENFILQARAKGCSDATVRYHHAGRNSLLPLVTSVGLHVPHLITGALFIEIVFAYPGVGSLLYNALLARDYPLIQGILLMVALTVLFVNLLVDLLYCRIDPRVRHAP